MQDDANLFRPPLSDLSLKDWTQAMRKLGRQYGMYEELGQQHAALFVDDGPTFAKRFVPEGLDPSDAKAGPTIWDV